MDEQNFKFNYVFQGQDCTLSTGVYKITIQNHVYIGSAAISFRKRWRQHQLDCFSCEENQVYRTI